jgi:dUTP pyrophosphatase
MQDNSSFLLQKYDKVMHLKLFVSNNDDELKQRYQNAAALHNAKVMDPNNHFLDAGFDLFVPFSYTYSDMNNNNNSNLLKVDHQVQCCAQMYTDTSKVFYTGYYMDPRSSISKTSYRLANSRGIIDSGYRGNLIGMLDIIKQPQTEIQKFDRLLQICAPALEPIYVEIVDSLSQLGEETARGTGGIGSSGR